MTFNRSNLSGPPGAWTFGVEWLCCLGAMAGLVASLVAQMNVAKLQGSASDFKTLYASVWCFAKKIDAFRMNNIEQVFRQNHVVTPVQWYGHMPVYPPFTLALLSPLASVGMVPAAYLWIAFSGLMMAVAMWLMLRASDDVFGLSLGWRVVIVVLWGASPLLGFGLEMGNVSVAVSALCIGVLYWFSVRGSNRVAALPRRDSHWNEATVWGRPAWQIWTGAIALAVALSLKPHLAVWVLLALLASAFGRDGQLERKIVLRALGVCVVLAAAVLLWLSAEHMLGTQMRSYRAIVLSETNDGSMAATNREVLLVAAQITSLQSAAGYWVNNDVLLKIASKLCVVGLMMYLVAMAWRLRRGRTAEQRLLLVGCWCCVGMLATYHRAHDGIVLLLLTPWVVWRLRRNWRDGLVWLLLALYFLMSWGPSTEWIAWCAQTTHMKALCDVLLYRQAPLATLGLMAVLLVLLEESVRGAFTKRDHVRDTLEAPLLTEV